MKIRVKSSAYVAEHYAAYGLRAIRGILNHQYQRWVTASSEGNTVDTIDAWAYVKGLVTIARARGAFNEKTWEIDT